MATTAVWLQYAVTAPDGTTETFQRTVKDSLGPDVRLSGGQPDVTIDLEGPSFLTPEEQYVNWVLPNDVPEWAYSQRVAGLVTTIKDLGEQTAAILEVGANLGDEYTEEQVDTLVQAVGRFSLANTDSLGLTGLKFAHEADTAVHTIEASTLTSMYYATPRLFAVGTTMDVTTTFKANVDLRSTTSKVIVAPGQSLEAEKTARWLQGQVESELEGAVLEAIYEDTAVTAANIFAAMPAQNIEPILIRPDQAYLLDLYPYSADGKANMLAGLQEGKTILAPTRHVLIDGELTLAWWEIDPITGETISVGEDGLHTAAVNWAIVEMLVEQIIIGLLEYLLGVILDKLTGGTLGGAPSASGIAQLAGLLLEIGTNLAETFYTLADAIGGNQLLRGPTEFATLGFLPAHLCPVDNCGIEQFFLDGGVTTPIPLPDMLFAYQDGTPVTPVASADVVVTANLPPGDPAFTLTAVPAISSVPPATAVNFQADIDSNFNDTFGVTVYAPDDWHVTIDNIGQVTAQSPSTAVPGDYTILVVAQSSLHPELTATAEHTVTITPIESMSLSLIPEANITVPMGDNAFDDISNQTNDSEAEIDDAAYIVELANTATTTHTYDIVVTGPTAGWVILNGARQTTTAVTLPPGITAQIGLYIQPNDNTIPTPATTFPINVTATATDNPALTDSDSDTFTMPSQPFNYVTLTPDTLYITPGGNAEFDLTMSNISNASGSFPIAATTPISTWTVANLQTPVSLNMSESDTQTAELQVPANTAVGLRTPLIIGSTAPGSYTQYALADVQIVSEDSGKIFAAANSCILPNGAALPPTIESLAYATVDLEASCLAGDCSLYLRDQVVVAIDEVADLADLLADGLTAVPTLHTLADDLATHTINPDIQADIVALGNAIATLDGEICEISEHAVTAQWTPSVDAALANQPITYTLDVSNIGTVTTTYAITLDLPAGLQTFNDTIPAGTTTSYDNVLTVAALDTYLLQADVTAVAPDVQLPVSAQANATLRVVDRFVQLTAVTPTPAFVETGVSSTTLNIDIANVANIARAATAQTNIIAPSGSLSYTADFPLNILTGPPQTYQLTSVNTSGWQQGLYTVTVNLVDGNNNPILDGYNFGLFAVGQAIGLAHSVSPSQVAPGTVTVTTHITTELLADTIITPSQALPLLWEPTGLVSSNQSSVISEEYSVSSEEPPNLQSPISQSPISTTRPTDEAPITTTLSPQLLLAPGYTRTEQSDPAWSYIGTWTNVNSGLLSGGSFYRANDPGDTATITVTGELVALGFLGGSNAGQIEIYIDGINQGVHDLYRREDLPLTFVFDSLINSSHTISVTVLPSTNPHSSNDYVQLDFVDVWDGTLMADGTFEQDDVGRVVASTGWNTVTDGTASGGTYIRDNSATVWFPFTGDSVTFHAIAYSGGGKGRVYIDGVYQTTLNFYNRTTITRALSFSGLGAGAHLLQISTYRGNTTADTFTTPSTGEHYTPPTIPGFTRYEEEHPDMLFNGDPYITTTRDWTRAEHVFQSEASDGQRVYSQTPGDTVSFTFNGIWVSIGFFTNENSGHAEIYLDGVSQGIVDLYSNEEGVISFTYDGLIAGSHTISATVLGTSNPFSNDEFVSFDYVDVWDGTPLAAGSFEENDARTFRSGGWTDVANANVSGGYYIEEVLHAQSYTWFPFEGDSVTYQAFNYFRSDEVAIYIDEVFQGYYDIRDNSSTPTFTHSFEGLGAGLHILKVGHHRAENNLDAFHTPAITPQTPPPAANIFTRHEEDTPGILYNGVDYRVTESGWDRVIGNGRSSDGQYITSNDISNTISFDFTGTWINVGFVTQNDGGQAAIFIDGNLQLIADTFTTDANVASFPIGGLADTNHTISMTILATNHPNSSGTEVAFDYFDTWDGTDLPNGTYEEVDPLVSWSDYYDDWSVISNAAASGGQYAADDFFSNDGTVWFPFTGDSVSFLGFANTSGDRVAIAIDGVWQGTYNLYSGTPISRAFSFDGLGAGPHIITVRHNRAELNVDGFIVPAVAASQPIVTDGFIRYEEDNPALVYNDLYEFTYRPQTWTLHKTAGQSSGRWHVYSGNTSSSVALTFNGRWATVGFRTRNGAGQAEIFIDGISQGIFDTNIGTSEDVTSFPFSGLITGTHTISVTPSSGTIYFDFIEIWDGTQPSDDYANIKRSEDHPRIHYSGSIGEYNSDTAYQGEYAAVTLLNTNSNIWYSFVGDSFTYLAYSRKFGGTTEVYLDGVLLDTVSLQYPFTEQPIAHHYTGLGDGAHAVRIHNGVNMRADAFRSNPPTPLTPYQPIVEWHDNEPAGNGAPAFGTVGIAASMAAGDVTGDGNVELAITADDMQNFGTLFLYRGDGSDTGDGDPIIWEIPFGGGAFRTWVGSPAIADLDGQPGAEIVVNAGDELYALYGDGTTYWVTDTVGAFEVLSSPAIANLDNEPNPEIVVNIGDRLYVFEHDGAKTWELALPNHALPPVLADMNDDGLPEIFVSAWSEQDVYLYEYNSGTPQLLWTQTLTTPLTGMFGSAAVADIDGLQPGGDDGPEIAIPSYGYLNILEPNGDILWSTPLDPGNPGGASIADVDGDGEVEIITGMRYDEGATIGRLYAVNADGTVLWSEVAHDSSSANVASVLDLNGDGIFEVAWNGKEQGFTIYNGADGSILFNEPLVFSLTGSDYSLFADVDLDGYAEVVAAALGGVRVFGFDGGWGNARPLWNQHTYHITNINDDLTVPAFPANSWDVHNTFRTQWPEASVLPIYDLAVTHTVAISGVQVLTGTFNVPPTNNDPDYLWSYLHDAYNPVITRTFQSVVSNLQPGEVRQVAQGTVVDYALASGQNRLTLPPLYVSAAHIIAIEPMTQTVGLGGTAVYTITLSNPAQTADSYTLSLAGLPTNLGITLPTSVPIPANSDVQVTLAITVPANAQLGNEMFAVTAVNNNGGSEPASAALQIIDGVDVSIEPPSQTADSGTPVDYTLTITNLDSIAQTYDLDVTGLAAVTAPAQVTVNGNSAESLTITAVAASDGPHPFTVQVTAVDSGATDSDSAVLIGVGDRSVAVGIMPQTAVVGRGSMVSYTVAITNLGTVTDGYDLAVTVPPGWSAELTLNGNPISMINLPPYVFNSQQLRLVITSRATASPGDYDVTVTAVSQTNSNITASDTVIATVLNQGVQIEIVSGPTTVNSGETAVWQVEVTNSGLSADTFDLLAVGIVSLNGTFTPESVSLGAGQSQTVQFSSSIESPPASYPWGVVAQSSSNPSVQAEDTAVVTVNGSEGVVVTWQPIAQTVTDTLTATFQLVVSNTGNVATLYDLELDLGAANGTVAFDTMSLPAETGFAQLVMIVVPQPGVYVLEATAVSANNTSDSAAATLTVVVDNEPPPNPRIYLPFVRRDN